MSVSFLPKTSLGKRSVILSGVAAMIAIALYLLAEQGSMITSDALISISGFISVSAQIVASVMAAVSFFRKKDRSLLLLTVMLLGLIVIGFIIGSSLEP